MERRFEVFERNFFWRENLKYLRGIFFLRENFGCLRGFWEIKKNLREKKYQKERENFEDDGSLKLGVIITNSFID